MFFLDIGNTGNVTMFLGDKKRALRNLSFMTIKFIPFNNKNVMQQEKMG